MKTLKFFFLFAFSIALVSCSSDDDNPSYEFNKDNLMGSYDLTSLHSKRIKTVNVEGFDIETTTTQEGSTFDCSYKFGSDNKVTLNGTYLITETKKQNGHTNDTTYIVNLNDKKLDYAVNADQQELTLDNDTYNVSNFSESGFKLKLSRSGTDEDGNDTEFTKEMLFKN